MTRGQQTAAERTSFDRFFDEQMLDPEILESYKRARREIDSRDQLVAVQKHERLKQAAAGETTPLDLSSLPDEGTE